MRRIALLATTILGLSVPALAQPVAGPYVSLGVGWNYLQDEQIKNISVGTTAFGTVTSRNLNNRNVNFGSGIVGLGSVGWGFGNGLRVELEGNYRGNYRNQNGQGPTTVNPGLGNAINVTKSGGEQKEGAMVNAFYDFTDAFGRGITPYIGAGVGYQRVELGSTQFSLLTPGSTGQVFNGRAGNGINAFGYQAIAGASYNLVSVDPGLYLTLEYRFLGVGGDRSGTGTISGTNGRSYNLKVSSGPEYNQGIVVGVRYAFNTPPPPPAPVAAAPIPVAAEARTYLVFFDWDRADLTDRARQIVAEAAQASTRVRSTVIQVNGYTDSSGSPAYNQKLSIRRAEIVRAELVKDGVPQGVITINGYGQNNPLVPTAAGVREPQNRRVEILIK